MGRPSWQGQGAFSECKCDESPLDILPLEKDINTLIAESQSGASLCVQINSLSADLESFE